MHIVCCRARDRPWPFYFPNSFQINSNSQTTKGFYQNETY